MSEHIEEAIQNAADKKPSQFKENVVEILKAKIIDRLDEKRKEIAAGTLEEGPQPRDSDGEKNFVKTHGDVNVHNHPVAGDNNFKGEGPGKKAGKRPLDNDKDGEKDDPTGVGKKLKSIDLSGKAGG